LYTKGKDGAIDFPWQIQRPVQANYQFSSALIPAYFTLFLPSFTNQPSSLLLPAFIPLLVSVNQWFPSSSLFFH
jgi:hypothetical protein